MFMYVYVYIYIYIYIYTHTYIHTHTQFTVYLLSQNSLLSAVDFNVACLLNELFHGAC